MGTRRGARPEPIRPDPKDAVRQESVPDTGSTRVRRELELKPLKTGEGRDGLKNFSPELVEDTVRTQSD